MPDVEPISDEELDSYWRVEAPRTALFYSVTGRVMERFIARIDQERARADDAESINDANPAVRRARSASALNHLPI